MVAARARAQGSQAGSVSKRAQRALARPTDVWDETENQKVKSKL
jgi:hypothetical protein